MFCKTQQYLNFSPHAGCQRHMHVVLWQLPPQALTSDPFDEGAIRLDVEALPLKPENTETCMWEHEERNACDLLGSKAGLRVCYPSVISCRSESSYFCLVVGLS